MKFCCHVAEQTFHDRNLFGEFLVAGFHPYNNEIMFILGFNMCHREDYSDVIGAIQKVSAALETENISNFKLATYGVSKYCHFCGKNLRRFYGKNGGALLDDKYFKRVYLWEDEA